LAIISFEWQVPSAFGQDFAAEAASVGLDLQQVIMPGVNRYFFGGEIFQIQDGLMTQTNQFTEVF
jgi:hypothetical protein